MKDTIAHLKKKTELISDKILPLKIRKHEHLIRDEYNFKINYFINNTKEIESNLSEEVKAELQSFINWYQEIYSKQMEIMPNLEPVLSEKEATSKLKEISNSIRRELSKEKQIKVEDPKNISIKTDL